MTLIGWLGALCFALCGFPQAWLSIKDGHSAGISSALLLLWCGGEILTLIYVIHNLDLPLIFNYTCSFISLSIISWYKIRPRNV